MRGSVLRSLVYFPSREIAHTPAATGLAFRELSFTTDDGILLCGWWITTEQQDRLGAILFCHGNAGNIADRLLEAQLLTRAGFDVLLFDYRGYGRSEGRADEQGTYRDALVARAALLGQPEADPSRVFYLGESLGGAVALHLALEHPPAGLILQSTFTSIRDMARQHYPFIPPFLIPDWYPSLSIVSRLRAPLLVLHGDRDDIVPLSHGQALYDVAPPPKDTHVFSGRGHNDLVATSGTEYGSVIAQWASDLVYPPD
jgi:pimeloyl-ACP methyl ester carboxylesterase